MRSGSMRHKPTPTRGRKLQSGTSRHDLDYSQRKLMVNSDLPLPSYLPWWPIAGIILGLVTGTKAGAMLANRLTDKTDKLDARGSAILLRNGTLPEVWIPPGELRDQRELMRLRILSSLWLRTRVKQSNPWRTGAITCRSLERICSASLLVRSSGRGCQNSRCIAGEAVEQELATLDFLNIQIESAEERLEAIMNVSVEADLLKTLPCVGTILSMVMMLEIGRAFVVYPVIAKCGMIEENKSSTFAALSDMLPIRDSVGFAVFISRFSRRSHGLSGSRGVRGSITKPSFRRSMIRRIRPRMEGRVRNRKSSPRAPKLLPVFSPGFTIYAVSES